MIKKFFGALCFIFALFDLFVIGVTLAAGYQKQESVYALYNNIGGIENLMILIIASILSVFLFLLLCAGLRLFRKKEQGGALVRRTPARIIEKILLLFTGLSVLAAAAGYFAIQKKYKDASAAFEFASPETVLDFVNELNARREKISKEIAISADDFQNKSKDGIKKRTAADLENKTRLMAQIIEGFPATGPFSEINNADRDGKTALMMAMVFSSGTETVKILLDHGALPNMEDNEGRNALMYAAMFCENPEIITMLVDRGSKLYYMDSQGRYPIHFAAQYNAKPEILESLVHSGAVINMKTVPAGSGRLDTPLILAVKYNNSPKVVSWLLKNGAQTEKITENDQTAIFYAAAYNKSGQVLNMLIDAGANLNKEVFGAAFTPLSFCAAYGNNAATAEMLIKRGAAVNAQDKKDILSSPFMSAAYGGNKEIIEIFVKNGADIKITNLFGMTAADIAAANPDAFEIAEHLRSLGIVPGNVAGAVFPYFVLVSALNENPAQIENFIANGANLNEAHESGLTPFAAACRFNRKAECIRVFLKHGLKFTDTDGSGKAYFEYLAENPEREILKEFIESGIIDRNDGAIMQKALLAAVLKDRKKTVKYLISIGVDAESVKDASGKSAAEHIKEKKY